MSDLGQKGDCSIHRKDLRYTYDILHWGTSFLYTSSSFLIPSGPRLGPKPFCNCRYFQVSFGREHVSDRVPAQEQGRLTKGAVRRNVSSWWVLDECLGGTTNSSLIIEMPRGERSAGWRDQIVRHSPKNVPQRSKRAAHREKVVRWMITNRGLISFLRDVTPNNSCSRNAQQRICGHCESPSIPFGQVQFVMILPSHHHNIPSKNRSGQKQLG